MIIGVGAAMILMAIGLLLVTEDISRDVTLFSWWLFFAALYP
jgi:hypothetical protein